MSEQNMKALADAFREGRAVDLKDVQAALDRLARIEAAPMAESVKRIGEKYHSGFDLNRTEQATLLDAYRMQSLALNDANRDYMRAMGDVDRRKSEWTGECDRVRNLAARLAEENERANREAAAREVLADFVRDCATGWPCDISNIPEQHGAHNEKCRHCRAWDVAAELGIISDVKPREGA